MTAPVDWTEKYRPQALADIIGNKTAVEFFWNWVCAWEHKTPEKKAVILYGPPGVGKTSAALALASQIGWETIEMNASDQRTATSLERVAGSASQMATLTGGHRRLILLDEADNMHGSSDRGGARTMAAIIRKSGQPIVLIANDLYGISSSIRALCEEIKFSSVQQRSIIAALKKICQKENIMCSTGVLEKIASMSGGDLRSALRDLQAVATGKSEIYPEDVATAERDTKESIFKILSKVFQGDDPVAAHKATFDLNETPEDLIQWVDENLPGQYLDSGQTLNEDLGNAYRNLSHADRYLGRVRLRQNYGLWRYAGFLLSGGIAASKKHQHQGFRKLQPPSVWRRMGQMRARRDMRDNIASKISRHCHEPMIESRSDSMRMYSKIVEDDGRAVDVATVLRLDADEIAYLKGKKVGKKIQGIYDQSLKRLGEREAEDIDVFIRGKEVKHSTFSLDSFSVNSEIEEIPVLKPEKTSRKKSQKTLFDF
jgi:replication factor C large subunit